jgi:hypothetical protein
VRAVTLLYQFQRAIDAKGRIVADLADYEVARRLLIKPLDRALGGQISSGAIRFHQRLKVAFGGASFSTTEAVQKVNMARQTVHDYLWELSGVGAVTQIERGSGCKAAIWLLEQLDWNESRNSILPSVSDIESLCKATSDLTQTTQKRRRKQQSTTVSGEILDEAEKSVPEDGSADHQAA